MCFGSTLIYPHEEFLIPRPHPQQVQPARKAVRVPAPAPQMRVPATRRTLMPTHLLHFFISHNSHSPRFELRPP